AAGRSAGDRQGRAAAAVQAPARDVPVIRARRYDRDRYGAHLSLSRARQWAGDALRHRRRPRGLHLGGRRARIENVRVAGLASAGRGDADAAPTAGCSWQGGRCTPPPPRVLGGGERNPRGARALYLGKTLYRIHGTNQPSTIGKYVSSGCIRLTNEDIADLYSRVQVGTRVVVLPGSPPATASNAPPPAQAPVQQR